jgi:hypothetical protein
MAETAVPDVLTHYYDAARGPFRSLTALPPDDANRLQAQIVAEARGFASQRTPDYLAVRRELEQRIRRLFVAKGGCPERDTPHYFIVGTCDWMLTWYERPACLGVPLASVDPAVVSLTYGDSFPAMRYPDGKPWRGQVYTLGELPDLIARFGLPQIWNADGSLGPDRYIEAQVWSDAPLRALDLLE